MKELTREKFPEGQEDETNSKDLKIRPERSWYTLLYTTVTGGGGGGGGEESQRNQRENAATRTVKMGKTKAIKGKQRNTAIHLLTQGRDNKIKGVNP